jgi:endoglucanase
MSDRPPSANDPANIYGVNLAGGEFNDAYIKKVNLSLYGNLPVGAKVPYGGGRYYYPSKPQEANPANRHLQMDYFFNKGVRIMRLPIKWERVQPELYGPLYYGPDEPFTSSNDLDMRRILECIDYWTNTLGGYVLLDLHNYMGYTKRVIDPATGLMISQYGKIKYDSTIGLDVYALVDVWLKFANLFADNTKVWFGIMNEPSGDGATARRNSRNMQTVVNMIRSRTPARNKILVAGSSFSNCRKWVLNGNADAFNEFYDPLDNFAFEPHNYIDPDQSGTKGTCVIQTMTNNQMTDITEWARPLGFKILMGEVAGGNPTTAGQENCAYSVPVGYQYMQDNADVWIGWTTWAGGFPASYMFSLEPSGNNYLAGTDSGCMQMLLPFLPDAP